MQTCSTAMYLPPPARCAYTFRTLPGIARSSIPRMLASVGMPAMLTCSSLGPMQVWSIGRRLCVRAFTFSSQHSELAAPLYPGNSGMA